MNMNSEIQLRENIITLGDYNFLNHILKKQLKLSVDFI